MSHIRLVTKFRADLQPAYLVRDLDPVAICAGSDLSVSLSLSAYSLCSSLQSHFHFRSRSHCHPGKSVSLSMNIFRPAESLVDSKQASTVAYTKKGSNSRQRRCKSDPVMVLERSCTSNALVELPDDIQHRFYNCWIITHASAFSYTLVDLPS